MSNSRTGRTIDKDKIRKAISGDYKSLVEVANELGKKLKEQNLSTSQIRNVFGSIKKMEMEALKEDFNVDKLYLLMPRISYAASRPGAKGVDLLKEITIHGIKEVFSAEDYNRKRERFKNFCQFFEAVLAYHRAYGGK